MYSAGETYTLIFDSAKGAGMAKDTSVSRVVVEELNLPHHRIKSYLFLRENDRMAPDSAQRRKDGTQ